MNHKPEKQWWAINGQVLLDALHQVRNGDDPDVVYLELFANSDTEEVGEETDDG